MNKSVRLLLVLATACTACAPVDRAGDGPAPAPGGASTRPGSLPPVQGALPTFLKTSRPALAGFGRLADRGDLVGYPARRVVRQDGAYTWHRADLSEAHALQALASGWMRVTLPDGRRVDFRYERHIEHPGGDWTWVGHVLAGRTSDEIIVTFGAKAAFGTIARPGATPLNLLMRDGVSWLVETDPAKVAQIVNPATRPTGPDYLLPPPMAASALVTSAGAASTTAAPANAATTLDVVLGYTQGFASYHGGQSQALTRLNFLVDVTNEAYVNSQVDARVRLVHTLQVDYADATDNGETLEALTGYKSGTGTIPVPAALQPLRAARDQYGGDLVSLVRKFNTPENDGCGIAWLIGGGRTTVDGNDAPFGYSVVSDGQDAGTDGKTYFCRQETLGHELGHNMGLQHDRDTADGDDNVLQNNEYGAFAYSFGYRAGAGAGNFYTVMAYGESGQTPYRVFSNPRINLCGGLACGVVDAADNARALASTVPVIAQFRAAVQAGAPPDLYVVAKQGASGRTELHRLSGASRYASWDLHVATALQPAPNDRTWKYLVGDYNRDGVQDLYLVLRTGASGTTEVHVLDGATRYQSFLLHAGTALHPTGSEDDWDFGLGDYDRNGSPDLFVIKKAGASGTTEVHVLNGSNRFGSWLLNVGTALHPTAGTGAWDFVVADSNRDGIVDVLAVGRAFTGSGRVEVHVLDGASRYGAFNRHVATPLDAVGPSSVWDFKTGDYNRDGNVDLYVVLRTGASNSTEVHVLDGASGFTQWRAHHGTALHVTGDDFRWDFDPG